MNKALQRICVFALFFLVRAQVEDYLDAVCKASTYSQACTCPTGTTSYTCSNNVKLCYEKYDGWISDDMYSLSLACAGLKSLPKGLEQFDMLTYLDLSKNSLSSLPSEMVSPLISLTYLNLTGNMLTSIPSVIGSLSSLSSLYIGYNYLTTIPSLSSTPSKLTMDNNYIYCNDLPSNIRSKCNQDTQISFLTVSGSLCTTHPLSDGALYNGVCAIKCQGSFYYADGFCRSCSNIESNGHACKECNNNGGCSSCFENGMVNQMNDFCGSDLCGVHNCNRLSGCTCNGCAYGYALSNGKCCKEISACASYNSDCTCSSCESGYGLVSGSCQMCPVITGCASYNSDCTCSSCESGYKLVSGSCQMCPVITGCASYNSDCTCSMCPVITGCASYNSDCTCSSCNSNCRSYNSDCTCNECYSYDQLVGDKCCPIIDGCKSYDDDCTCKKCYSGYDLSYGTCCNQIDHCESYDGNCDCYYCEDEYQRVGDKCCPIIDSCNSYDDDCTCKKCYSGYELTAENQCRIKSEPQYDEGTSYKYATMTIMLLLIINLIF